LSGSHRDFKIGQKNLNHCDTKQIKNGINGILSNAQP
jgi:hypothetical protein